MKHPIAISLSPNADAASIRLAFHMLFHPKRWKDAAVLQCASRAIALHFPKRFVVLASSGRQALYDLLRVFEIGKDDEVIIQAFTCIAVPEPILWVGAKPVYADIAQGSYSSGVVEIEKQITSHTRCIIVQYTFGIPAADIQAIVALAKKHNLILIEDCAHAFGSLYADKMVGTFGDAAILSFGRDKCLSSVYGGASLISSSVYAEKLRVLQSKRSQPPRAWIMQQLLHPIIFSVVVPLYFVGSLGKLLLVAAQELGLISRAVEPLERKGKRPAHIAYAYSPALASLLIVQLTSIGAMNDRRRTIAQRYITELEGISGILLPHVPEASKPSWLRFPILVQNPRTMLLWARKNGMLLGDWYDSVLVPAKSNVAVFRYAFHTCPNAEEVVERVINLPTYARMTDDQVSEVVAFVKHYAHTNN